MRVKIDDQIYELEYKEFVRWVRAGKIPPDSLIWSRLLTDGQWRRAGDMVIFQRLMDQSASQAETPEIPLESLISAREKAAFSLAQQKLPRITLTLIGINGIFYVLQILAGGSEDLKSLVTMGAYSRYLILHEGQWWRLVTHAFLHIGFLHLFVNMLILLLLGHLLEGIYGRQRFLLLYFFSILGGGIGSLLFVKDQIGAGASGAIFGLMATLIVFGVRYKERIPARRRRNFGIRLLPFLLIDLMLGFLYPGINIPAHLGGLIVGALLALILPPQLYDDRVQEGRELRRFQVLASVAVLVMLLSGGAMAIQIPEGHRNTRSHYKPLFVQQARNYEALLEVQPDNMRLYEKLQQVYFELRDLEPENPQWTQRLIQLYRQAIEQDPLSPTWYNNLAWIYAQEKMRTEEALALAKRAVELAPNVPNQLDTLGWCYLRAGKLQQALSTFERVFEVLATNESKIERKIANGIAQSSLDGLQELVQAGLPEADFLAFYDRIVPRLRKFPRWVERLKQIRRFFHSRL